MTQEIIVYRNPAEKAVWDFITSGDAFPVMVAVLVFFVVLVVSSHIMDQLRILRDWRYADTRNRISMGVAVVAAIVVGSILWI